MSSSIPSFGPTAREHAAHRPHLRSVVLVEQQLLAAGAGAEDVDGREDALLGQLAVEVQLHVAGALELLVDDVVHARAGVDQAGGDDRQAAAVLDVARGAEEALRRVEGDRVDTAGERLARWRQGQVVGARQARDGVEQDDDVAPALDQALGALEAISATRVWFSIGSSKVEA